MGDKRVRVLVFTTIGTIVLVAAILLIYFLTTRNSFTAGMKQGNQLDMPAKGEKTAVITTSMGVIKAKFLPSSAPLATENFIKLSQQGYYNGLQFHRVVKNFVIQTGDPTATGTGGQSIWGKAFKNEWDGKARHYRGALGMANSGQDYTNGSQFYIVQAPAVSQNILSQMANDPSLFPAGVINDYKNSGGYPSLDGGSYTVFGEVFEGMDIVDAIAGVKVDKNDKPLDPVTVISIEITTYEG